VTAIGNITHHMAISAASRRKHTV